MKRCPPSVYFDQYPFIIGSALLVRNISTALRVNNDVKKAETWWRSRIATSNPGDSFANVDLDGNTLGAKSIDTDESLNVETDVTRAMRAQMMDDDASSFAAKPNRNELLMQKHLHAIAGAWTDITRQHASLEQQQHSQSTAAQSPDQQATTQYYKDVLQQPTIVVSTESELMDYQNALKSGDDGNPVQDFEDYDVDAAYQSDIRSAEREAADDENANFFNDEESCVGDDMLHAETEFVEENCDEGPGPALDPRAMDEPSETHLSGLLSKPRVLESSITPELDYSSLNEKQCDAFKTTIELLRQMEQIRNRTDVEAVDTYFKLNPLRLLLGEPGAGKTFFAQRLGNALGGEYVLVLGPTGTSAAGIRLTCGAGKNGQAVSRSGLTIHSGLSINCQLHETTTRERGNKTLNALTVTTIAAKQREFANVRLLIIDEMSMIPPTLLWNIHYRMCQFRGLDPNIPCNAFGGVTVLMMGDAMQLPPISSKKNMLQLMYERFLSPAAYLNRDKYSEQEGKGLDFMEKFVRMPDFDIQMRVLDPNDPHIANLKRMRQLSETEPSVTIEIWDWLVAHFVTAQKLMQFPQLDEAAVATTGNEQRAVYMQLRAVAFAERTNQLIYRWRLPLTFGNSQEQKKLKTDVMSKTAEELTHLYEGSAGQLYGYFIKGAPMYITSNINPMKQLANGTMGIMSAMHFTDDRVVTEVNLLATGKTAGQIVDLPDRVIPKAIVVAVPKLIHSEFRQPVPGVEFVPHISDISPVLVSVVPAGSLEIKVFYVYLKCAFILVVVM